MSAFRASRRLRGGVFDHRACRFSVNVSARTVKCHTSRVRSSLQAKLTDGREYAATVVGTDPATDIAVLRLNSGEGVPTVPMGDSSKLRVGQVCRCSVHQQYKSRSVPFSVGRARVGRARAGRARWLFMLRYLVVVLATFRLCPFALFSCTNVDALFRWRYDEFPKVAIAIGNPLGFESTVSTGDDLILGCLCWGGYIDLMAVPHFAFPGSKRFIVLKFDFWGDGGWFTF